MPSENEAAVPSVADTAGEIRQATGFLTQAFSALEAEKARIGQQQSNNLDLLAGALAKAQGAMGFAKKDAKNPFFKSNYADLASCIDAIREPMASNGLSYLQRVETTARSVGVITILLHSSGQWIENGRCSLPVSEKPTAQSYGSLLTYARRYSLCAALGIAAEDDDGNAASGKYPSGASGVR